MIKCLLAILASFFIGMLIAPIVINLVKKMRVRQTILSYVQQHQSKQGVPTMGGFIFILPTIIVALVLGGADYVFIVFGILVMSSYAIIGFLDDFLKVILKRNLGLRGYQKIVSQLVIAVIATFFSYKNQFVGSEIRVPIINIILNLNWWYIPFSILVYIAVTNSVNLTDGLDGLAGTTSIIYFIGFLVIIAVQMMQAEDIGNTLYAEQLYGVLIFLSSLIGGLVAFLWFNAYKAKIIMGDMGSMALGGCGAMVAMVSKNPFLILIIGIMFVLSSISVIIQVAVYKTKHKRVFLMSPLHHHIELKGIHESKIVAYYALITFIAGVVSLIVM